MLNWFLGELKFWIKVITVLAGICIYVNIWCVLIENWRKFMYSNMKYLCYLWIIIHLTSALALILWGWGII